MPRRPLALAACLTLALVGPLAGCSLLGGDPDLPDADAAASALATALARERLGDGLVDGSAKTATKDLRAVVDGMGDVEPTVDVADVEVSGSESSADEPSAAVTLTWTWPLDTGDWSYTSTATLGLTGEAHDDDGDGVDDRSWLLTWAPSVVSPDLADGWVLERSTLAAARGDITGAGGQTIVTERPVVTFGLDKAHVHGSRALASARTLARLTDIDVADYVAQVKAAGDSAYVEAITYRVADVPRRLARTYQDVPGVLAVRSTRPLAPTRDFAAPILGTVGDVTAEMVEDDPDTYQAGDVAGLSGLQSRYDERLRGTAGELVQAVPSQDADDPDADPVRLHRVAAQDGQDLALSLDVPLQEKAEALLADVGPASALVAIRPSTGAVLVAANGPGNDGINVATYGQAAPGSTFKIVSSLALLRTGLTPTSKVSCTTTATVDGRAFENYDGYPASGLGRVTLATAVANSCNTAFISSYGRLGDGDLASAAETLGLGVDHEVGFPAYFGQVPDPESETTAAADMIGQGTVLASPLAMATVIGSVQEGSTVVPWLVKGHEDAAPDDAVALTGTEARQLRSLLRGVVTQGSGSLLADLPGKPVIAKTGTAEFDDDGTTRTHAWMVAAQGDLAVAVYVAVGDSGSGTAGPILKAFLRAAQ
ncbi:penicillin-binding transpeptidase domain-containing protein [Nocardioides sp. GY 10127]|uniref:penicillin-binding transpeptidase domain-containing protein n=1 Tax=Nocardioides sp. GY 10127 TaxID=2569762 RepID=UPI0010A77E7D|nr:penicillin-binding transpeptidase domain-containing protein [Nocardioides sp. GY 10127]TIC82847.1 penicillin-binding protein [Nocardioides sp. GY 10127]